MSEALQHEKEINEEAIKPEDRVPLIQKMAYGMGVVSDQYANVCISLFFMAFFNDFMGISAKYIGLALMTARIWDAFTDPMVGSLSDRSKSRFGRRKPFIFWGCILTGLFFPVIWMAPESWGQTAIVVFLFAALLIYYTFYSIFSVPYESLGTELTPDYKERTNIFVIRAYVQQVFNLGIIWVFPLATWLAMKPGINGEIGGVRAVSWLIGFMIIFAGVLPAISCVERYKDIAAKQESGSFFSGFKSLLTNVPLLIVIGIICTYLLAIMATMNLAYYVNTYFVYSGKIHAGATLGAIDGTLRFSFAIIGAVIIKRLTNKYDKHHMMMACVLILLVAFVGIYFTTIPGRPWLSLTMKPLLAFGEVGFWILIISMRADVCDWDEYKTNKRREGLVAASSNWFVKMTIAGSVLLAGFLLSDYVRFDSKIIRTEDHKEVILANANAKASSWIGGLSAEEKAELNAGNYTNWLNPIIAEETEKVVQVQLSRVAPNVFGEGDVTQEQLADVNADLSAELIPGVSIESLSKELGKVVEKESQQTIDAELKAKAEVLLAEIPEEERAEIKVEHGVWVRLFKAFPKDKDQPGLSLGKRLGLAIENGGKPEITVDSIAKELEMQAVMEKQSPGTMKRLLYAYTIPQIVALIIAFILLAKYPLTHERLMKIREELEERRGKTISS